MARGGRTRRDPEDWLILKVEVQDFDLGASFNCAKPSFGAAEPWLQFASLSLAGRTMEFEFKSVSAISIELNLDTGLDDPARRKQLEERPLKMVGFLDARPERLSVHCYVPALVFGHACCVATSGKRFWVNLLCSRIRHRKAEVRSVSLSTALADFD
jgi:hypothetical protein